MSVSVPGAGVIHCDIRPKNVFMQQRLGASGAREGVGTRQAILADFDVRLVLGFQKIARMLQIVVAESDIGHMRRCP